MFCVATLITVCLSFACVPFRSTITRSFSCIEAFWCSSLPGRFFLHLYLLLFLEKEGWVTLTEPLPVIEHIVHPWRALIRADEVQKVKMCWVKGRKVAPFSRIAEWRHFTIPFQQDCVSLTMELSVSTGGVVNR